MTTEKFMSINEVDVSIRNESYAYFACTCHEDDKKYWDNIVQKITGDGLAEPSSSMIYAISHAFDGQMTYAYADMWMGIGIEIIVHGKTIKMDITCDQLQYGLAAAIVIAAELSPENAKDYELNGLLNN